MISTFTVYADFLKVLRTGFTVGPFLYYFDDTAGTSGEFMIWAVFWADSFAMQIALTAKPATFGTDFEGAIKLTSAMVLS